MNQDHAHTPFDLMAEPSVGGFFSRLLTADFMPHGHCFFWRPEILWLHVGSDFIIGLAYYLIPLALFQFVKKRHDLIFNWMFLLFAVFIFACGTTHFMSIWTMWHGTYRLEGIIKGITAFASITTAILLYPLIPKALSLRSPAELEREVRIRTDELSEQKKELEKSNQALLTATEKLEQSNENLLRINKELEMFAHIASHDLQEPLRTVSTYSDLLGQLSAGKFTEEERTFIRHIREGAGRSQLLIREWLEYVGLGSGRFKFRETDMRETLGAVLDNLAPRIAETKAEISSDNLPVIKADGVQMAQLFQNLISNAIKYKSEKPVKIHVGVKDEGESRLFSVQDNGIGIAEIHHERIFKLFQRLHHKNDYPGTGIGLAICKKIADNHKGEIFVDSKPGEGAAFYIRLPKSL